MYIIMFESYIVIDMHGMVWLATYASIVTIEYKEELAFIKLLTI